jgi:hypothetical protein
MTTFPDSPAPYRPLNPWGRKMPKPARRLNPPPVFEKGEAKITYLWQVEVSRVGDKLPIRVGPKMVKDLAEHFCSAINVQISLGKERRWTEPRLVRCN